MITIGCQRGAPSFGITRDLRFFFFLYFAKPLFLRCFRLVILLASGWPLLKHDGCCDDDDDDARLASVC